eukprot:364602-Chlamydomonas_euryale.AAC.21
MEKCGSVGGTGWARWLAQLLVRSTLTMLAMWQSTTTQITLPTWSTWTLPTAALTAAHADKDWQGLALHRERSSCGAWGMKECCCGAWGMKESCCGAWGMKECC